MITREEFIKGYEERSNLKEGWMGKWGQGAYPCSCDSGDCEGWQMINTVSYLEDLIMRLQDKQRSNLFSYLRKVHSL